MKTLALASAALAAVSSIAAPTVSNVSMTQSNSQTVKVDYTLDEAAVVTLDVLTNATAGVWASIGANNIKTLWGDVGVLVQPGTHTIYWAPEKDWIEAHPGRFAYNDPDTGGAGSGFVQSAIYRLIEDESARMSNDPKWLEYMQPGLDWLVKIHPFLYTTGGSVLYPAKNQGTLDLLINKEVDIIPAWADQILNNIASGTLPETTRMYQLDDMPLTGSDVSLGITSIGSNPDGAHEFIAFVISPEGQKICLENMKAIPVISPDLIDSDQKELVASLGNYSFISNGNLWKEEIYPLWQETILPL